MPKINPLRRLVYKRKIRKVIHEVYSKRTELNSDALNHPLPLGRYSEIVLYLSKNGFYIIDSENPDRNNALIHLPFTNRHYLIYSEPNNHKTFSVKIKELCDLISDLNPELIKSHFEEGIKKYHYKK